MRLRPSQAGGCWPTWYRAVLAIPRCWWHPLRKLARSWAGSRVTPSCTESWSTPGLGTNTFTRVDRMPASLIRNLIAGGEGLHALYLVDRLMQAGEEVICLDNYFTGRKANISRIDHHRFELIRQASPSRSSCSLIGSGTWLVRPLRCVTSSTQSTLPKPVLVFPTCWVWPAGGGELAAGEHQ